jgi:hypothetical protein
MYNRGEVVFCLIGETCLVWIFGMTVVVGGEVFSSLHSYDYESFILHKRFIRDFYHPLLPHGHESILILFSPPSLSFLLF